MLQLTPGVVAAGGCIVNAEEAAVQAARLAERAAEAGTFGVGGFLMDRSGRILAEAVNAVVRDGQVQDPTAHVERQLVDWYFEARQRGLQVESQDLIIVSSLDPCAMCAGAILVAEMNAVALAEDPVSGIHEAGHPHRMPCELWPRAEASMGLFGVQEQRAGRASHLADFLSHPVSAESLHRADAAFRQSVDHIRQLVGGGHPLSPDQLPPITSLMLTQLRTLVHELPETACFPATLIEVNRSTDQSQVRTLVANDGSILIDPQGVVLLAATGREAQSPARSSILELARAYVHLRSLAQQRYGLDLPHQRHCSVVKQRLPPRPDKSLLEFGALGSFFEEPHLPGPFPACGFLEPFEAQKAERIVKSLPPFYTSVVGISVGSVGIAT